MAGTMLEWVLVDETIEGVRQGTRHVRRPTGAGTIRQALKPMVGKAMDPCAQRGIGKVQRVGDSLEALAFDNFTDRLGTSEPTGLFGLLQERR